MKRCNVIIPIDTNFFDSEIISKLGHMYETIGKIHLSVMGPRFELVNKVLCQYKSRLSSIYEISAPGFNYAYAVNKMLRDYLTNGVIGEEEPVVLTDLWSVASLLQLERKFIHAKWERDYIDIPIWRESMSFDPISIKSQRLILSVIRRAERCKKERKHNSIELVPIVIMQSGILMNKIHGLEERLFTDKSRLVLLEQIKRYGLIREDHNQIGLRLSVDEVYNPNSIQLDKNTFPEIMESIEKHPGFIPSNIGIDFGSPERILQLVLENNKIYWRGSRKDTIVVDHENIDDSKEEQFEDRAEYRRRHTRIIEPDDPLKRIIKDPSLNGDVLVMLNNELEDVICSTPLIKALYQRYANVDILTDKKVFPHINLIHSMMIRNIFEIGDLQKPLLKLNGYKRIIKTYGCKIELAMDCNFIECEKKDNKVESNLSPKGIELAKHFSPYCYYTSKNIMIPTNTVILMSSIDPKIFRSVDPEYPGFFSRLLKYMLEKNLEVMTVNIEGEMNHIQYQQYKKRTKNFKCAERVPINDVCMLIKYANLVITSPYSQAFWLAYGLKQKSLIVMDDDSKIILPNYRFNYASYDQDVAVEGITQWVLENY